MKGHAGFTLIELIIVIIIIFIIVGSTGYVLSGGFEKRRDADRIVALAHIQATLEFYLAEHGNFDTLLATDGASTSHNGQIFTEAVYYSTPTAPTLLGRHDWNSLITGLGKYGRGLPNDPRNAYASWLPNGDPDYTSPLITQGYILVRIYSENVRRLSGCTGAGFSREYVAGYSVETVLEQNNAKASDHIREPRLFGCIQETDPQAHILRYWGTIKQ